MEINENIKKKKMQLEIRIRYFLLMNVSTLNYKTIIRQLRFYLNIFIVRSKY